MSAPLTAGKCLWFGLGPGGGEGRGRYPVSEPAAGFIGLLCGNADSSCGDFHAFRLNRGIVFICVVLSQKIGCRS